MKRTFFTIMLTLPVCAVAAPGAYYFGGTVAHVSGKGVTAGLDDTSNSTLEDTRSGMTLFWGHRFLSGSALELSYIDLGESDGASSALVDGQIISNESLRPMNTEGAAVNYITNIPIEKLFEINMSVGVMRWVSEYGYQEDGVSQEASESGFDITYGLGATRDLGQNCIGRFGWTRFQLAGEAVNVGSIGMAYTF